MKPEDLEKNGLIQFRRSWAAWCRSTTSRASRPARIRLTGALLADIYLGKVKKWNDAALTQS